MHSNDIIAMVLAKPNAIADWRKTIGPTDSRRAREEAPETLRAIYGHDHTRDALHGSDSQFSAEREIKYIFPGCELVCVCVCISCTASGNLR